MFVYVIVFKRFHYCGRVVARHEAQFRADEFDWRESELHVRPVRVHRTGGHPIETVQLSGFVQNGAHSQRFLRCQGQKQPNFFDLL